jgi:hypothetical protein
VTYRSTLDLRCCPNIPMGILPCVPPTVESYELRSVGGFDQLCFLRSRNLLPILSLITNKIRLVIRPWGLVRLWRGFVVLLVDCDNLIHRNLRYRRFHVLPFLSLKQKIPKRRSLLFRHVIHIATRDNDGSSSDFLLPRKIAQLTLEMGKT